MDDFDFGDFDPVEAEERTTRSRQLQQYCAGALQIAAAVERVFVLFPQFGACLAACDRAFQLSRTLNTPQGILIKGEPGSGKTTVAKYFIRSLPQSDLFDHGFGALLIRLRTAPTTAQAVGAMLRAVKYPFTSVKRTNVHTMRDIAFESIQHHGTRIIFIDQAHSLSYQAGQKRKDVNETTVSDLLVELMDQTGVSLCLLADANFTRLEDVAPALASRVTVREALSEFRNDEYWAGFLCAFARQAKAIALDCLTLPDIQQRTYTATMGNRRRFRRLIVEAVLIASDGGAAAVAKEHLARAFALVTGTASEAPNPYVA
ncbi:ATP-binding protein [Rhodocyclus tenuis]|uniref:Nucleoside-triphosphatase THEP1 n=1 Tax=Rhodocyclus tenuis TaxID=1066 RepID=A0A840GB41_RHOTE|nr:ATP-binding protein [Rhodocyclus tenuis]MBB4245842.1 nucleoside-triphosphatase THEP1 [Rhodocyclus tenuis]